MSTSHRKGWTPTAHAPTQSLLTSLARAGWGDELGSRRKGVRAVLSALVRRLPFTSGQGLVTLSQLAEASTYSARWVSECLGELEEMGLIERKTGGIVDGRRQPSFIRIVKTELVALIHAARGDRDAAARRRARQAPDERRPRFVRNTRRRFRRSVHVEVSSDLLPPSGEEPPPPAVECRHGEPRGPRYCALCRRAADADRMAA